jgi:UDP-N-acetylglucosamine 1-carboxyvinyltransferase
MDKVYHICYILTMNPKNTTELNQSQKIGYFIKKLRESKGLTQGDFAKSLKTTQSAVARIEGGKQNLTLEQLAKISDVLERNIVTIPESIDFKIHGGRKLSGSIETNTSKNGAINMLCATLLNEGKTILHDIPNIEEVYRYISVLESLGVKVRWIAKKTLEVERPKIIQFSKLNRQIANEIRSFTFLGALIHEGENFHFPNSGGCKMGARTISAHKYGLEKLGVKITTKESSYIIEPKKLKATEVTLYESSDTGAINLLLAAAKIPGTTIIKFAPPNYQVQDVCFLLEKMGVKIDGIGTTTLTVHGVKEINLTVEHYNSEDPIESMFFIAAAVVTDSTLTITRVPIEFIRLEIEKLKHMGQKMTIGKKYLSKNKRTELADITVIPSKLKALHDKIHTQPFPGLQNDNLPFFVPIATKAQGTTLIHDWTWENRAIYFTELNRLGADITLLDPHRVIVTGGRKLKGAQIVSVQALRPSASIFIGMLSAEGVSTLRNVFQITRGYAEIAERLNAIGAKIDVIHNF